MLDTTIRCRVIKEQTEAAAQVTHGPKLQGSKPASTDTKSSKTE